MIYKFLVQFLSLSGVIAARLTYYESLPKCCPGTANYDPNYPVTDECKSEAEGGYNGCQWYGQVAYFNEIFDLAKLQTTNVVSLFTTNGGGAGTFAGKYITITKSGYAPFTALVADTCSDADCGGCCSANAGTDGWLVDVEYWTAVRHLQAANYECPLCDGTVTFTLAGGTPTPKPTPKPTVKPTVKPTAKPTAKVVAPTSPTTKPPTLKPPTSSNVCPTSQAGTYNGLGAPGSICVSSGDCQDTCYKAQCSIIGCSTCIPSCYLACPPAAQVGSGAGIPGAQCASPNDCIDDCVRPTGATVYRCTSVDNSVPACQ